MDNLSGSSNPYIIDEAVSDPVMFFGRTEVFGWIKETLNKNRAAEPLILYGPPGVGKSSILKKLEKGYLGDQTAVIHFDIQELPLEDVSDFFWALSTKINRMTVPTEVEIMVPLVEKEQFKTDPELAFDQFLTILLEKRLEGRQLILAFDDLDILAGQSQPGYVEHSILTCMKDLLLRKENLALIFTFNGPVDKLPEGALAPFELTLRCLVENFDLETTQTFLRQSALFNTSSVVGNYIYYLTGGHPGDIQRYCHELYQRRQSNKLLHITLADVVAVTRQSKESNGFQTPVLNKLAQRPGSIVVTDPDNPASPTSLPPKPGRFPGRFGLLIILILIISFAGVGYLLASNKDRPVPILATDLQTSTAEPNRPAPTAAETKLPTAESTTVSLAPTSAPTPSIESTLVPAETQLPDPTTSPPTPTITITPSPEPTALSGSDEIPALIIRETDEMPMLIVLGGTFTMGASDSDPAVGFDETPEHEVTINTFYMDKFEVTVSQYATFLNSLGTFNDACQGIDCAWTRGIIGYTSYLLEVGEEDDRQYEAMAGFEDYPINHVSWYGADSYCQAMGARLPTEAEWEYAARGKDGRIYPWGNEQPDQTRAVYFSQAYEDLKPVDALPDGASPFGIYGMAGSMWEWVSDWYDPNYYGDSPADNPQGPDSGEGKVSRGGAWPNNNQADRIRATNRNWREAAFFSPDLGFRCAASPENTPE